MKKVKILFVAFAITLLSLIGANVFAAEAAVLKTTPFETTQNETFKTTIYLEENSNLIDFQIQLKYDTELVSLVSAEEHEDLRGTMIITEKDGGIIHISYTNTSANITDKMNLVNLEFKVEDTVGPDSYGFLHIDETYNTQAHTMIGDFLEDLPLNLSFENLNIYNHGDVNLDGGVSIADVTYLRQHLASIRTLSDYQLKFADAYFDNVVSISDAVRIQQNLADENIILGNRVNVTFYDKDGEVLVVKSVKYGEDLSKLPTPLYYRGFTWLNWSANPDEFAEINLTNIQTNISVYSLYDQDPSEAITWYKEKLTQTYYMSNILTGNLYLNDEMIYQDGYTAKIYWSTENPAIINATTGEFIKPVYDCDAVLSAHIVSYKNNHIEAEDTIDFKYRAIGEFQCPTKEEIKQYLLGNAIYSKIDTNLSLPKKISNEDTLDTDKKYEVRINWAMLDNSNAEVGISQITRTAYEQNVTLVATVTFNGQPIDGDGKIYFDDITLDPITEKEVSDYVIDKIASNMGLSISDDMTLLSKDDKYDATIFWESKNNRIASISNNVIDIKTTAVNGEALPLVAEVTYPTGDGAVTFELSYTVNVVADNKLLVPGTNIDESLYDALKTATGTYGNLTTDALKDVKFVYLDLSAYPEITDLSGLTYCSNLRVLNISGLNITSGLNEIASLSKLESLIARGCGFYDNSFTDGGVPILQNMIYLKMLDLSYNNLTSLDSVLGENIRYGRLQELYLGNNQLTDISAISNAPLLRFLLLEDNLLESDDLENFHKFKVLKLLSLANNNIDSVSNLKNNRTLLELRLQGNNISDIRDLRYMTHMESLYLGHNNISNVFSGGNEGNVSYLKYMPNLSILYLNDNDIEDISDLTTLTKLKALNVSNNRIQSLSLLSQCSDTLVELYAENNDIQSLSFIRNLTKLKKLMVGGNSTIYDGTVIAYLNNLTELETLTISGKNLGTLSFLENMDKLVRLDVADCNLTSNEDLKLISDKSYTLKYLDISNNKFDDVSPLRNLSNLVVLYADNINDSVNASDVFALMSEIKYVSMENCGISDIGFLSKFRNLVYVNFAGNNLSALDLGTYISDRSTGTLKYLYVDSRTPFAFVNSYTSFDDNVLEELSMENVELDAVDYIPDMHNLKYLNISNSNIKDLRGSNPDIYGIFSIGRLDNGTYRFENLQTVDVTGVQADISVLEELPNLKAVYGVGKPNEKAFYESNITTLYNLYNNGVECYLYDYETPYEPIASTEGELILAELEDISCDITVAADNAISDNNPLLAETVNDFEITWSLSNESNYAVIDNQIAVVDYTNIADEELIVTAEITVYPEQASVTRDFIINTHILRADTKYLNIDSTGAGDYIARGAQFTYDVQLHAAETEGFTVPVMPVYDDVSYEYSVVLENGEKTPTENVLIIDNAPLYEIQQETEALESTVTIKTTIGHNETSGFVADKIIEKNMVIKTRTFEITYQANGGRIISNDDGATVTVRTYFEDAPLFEDITVSKAGHTFAGWYTDETLSTPFEGNTMPQENITLWAKWDVNSYTVAFESNEGSYVEEITAVYNSTILEPEEPTKEIHLFQGWYKDVDLTIPWNFAEDVVTGDITLYAKWMLNEYTVTFNANGGTLSYTSQKFVYGSTVEVPDATRDYYTFDGWYTDSSCTNAWNVDSDVVTEDISLYAKWLANDVSGWVLASNIPADAQVVDRKYTYTLTSYTTSTASSLSGWTKYDTKRTGWGSTVGPVYSNPSDGARNVWSEQYVTSSNYKTVYVYHRWTQTAADSGATYSYNTGYDHVYRFDSALTNLESNNWYGHKTYRYYYNGVNYKVVIYSGTEQQWVSDNYATRWYYQEPIYLYYYKKVENLENTVSPSTGEITNLQEWVQYRAK